MESEDLSGGGGEGGGREREGLDGGEGEVALDGREEEIGVGGGRDGGRVGQAEGRQNTVGAYGERARSASHRRGES